MLESWANRRKNARLVAEVVGDRQGKISRSKVDGHVQNVKTVIPNRKATVTPDGSYDFWIVRSVAIGPRCERSAKFATISSIGRIWRSISTRGRAITNDWTISMARAIVGNRATSGSDKRPMYDLLLRPTTDGTINRRPCCDWSCPSDHPRPPRPVMRSFYDLPTIPKKIGRS